MLSATTGKNAQGKPIIDFNRIDDYGVNGRGPDFDKTAKALNRYNGPYRPNTPTNTYSKDHIRDGLGSYDLTDNDVPIPLNAANRDIGDLVSSFDVSRLPDYDNMATAFCGHLLFSRPSLYLQCIDLPFNLRSGYTSSDEVWETDPVKNYFHFATEPMVSGFANDTIGRLLLHPLTTFSANAYMPLFTTRALNYSTNDIQLKSIEKGQTFYGHTIKDGHYSEDHKAGGTITLEFLNDRYWSILTTCYMWLAYIHLVSKTNLVRPAIATQTGGILDYAGSIYYLVTDTTSHRLVYWEKLTGVFPRSTPFSLLSTEDGPKVEGKVSIEFDYGIRSDPKDPSVLMDINMLTFGNRSDAERAMDYGPVTKNIAAPAIGLASPDGYRGGIMARANVEASRPVIRRRIDYTGKRDFYLEWFRRGVSTGDPTNTVRNSPPAVDEMYANESRVQRR